MFKRLFFWPFLAIAFVACNKTADTPSEGDGMYDLSEVSVAESGTITLEDFYRNMLLDATSTNADVDEDLYDFYATQLALAQGANTKGESGSSLAWSYAWTVLRYSTTSATGEKIGCSELLVWPYTLFKSPKPKHVIIGCHLTITSDDERPSNFTNLGYANDVNMLACFANPLSQSALVIIPDYEGYGATRSRNHPYCNRNVTAKQVVDGTLAGISWFFKEKKGLADGWRSVAVGYSQGGAAAAAVYRYCHENELVKKLRLLGAVCGDGPYDPMATLEQYVQDGKLYMPVAIALILKGAVDSDARLQELGCTYEDFCTREFVNTGIFNWLKDKSLNTNDIHNKLLEVSRKSDDGFKLYCWSDKLESFVPYTPANAADSSLKLDLSSGDGMNYAPVELCLKPSLVKYIQDGTLPTDIPADKLQAILQCMKGNSICADGWVPPTSGGLTFFHSLKDEVVPFRNLQAVNEKWSGAAGNYATYTYDPSGSGFHKAVGTQFYVSNSGDYTDNILTGEWTSVHE